MQPDRSSRWGRVKGLAEVTPRLAGEKGLDDDDDDGDDDDDDGDAVLAYGICAWAVAGGGREGCCCCVIP